MHTVYNYSNLSLEQFARSSRFFGISGVVQKDIKDGTVRVILYRITDYPHWHVTHCLFLFCDLEVFDFMSR